MNINKISRRRILFTILAAMMLSAVIVIVSMTYSIKRQRVEAHKQSIANSVVETQVEIGYTLKEYDGELAVFRGSSNTPYRKIAVSTSLMSDYDRNLLKKGIFVHTEDELKALIEDYTS